MIKDKLCNAELYYGISENLKNGFEWLKSQNLENIELKKHIINDDKLYANVQEYATKEDAKYEAHKKYIDIQYMISGKELIGVCDKSNCETAVSYDEKADIEFMECAGEEEMQTLNKGEFIVLFPSDAHKPSISPKDGSKYKSNTVRKVVVKVAIN